MQTKESIPVSTRITETMQKAMDQILQTSGHLNTSDYVRDLIRKDLAERGLLEELSSLNGTLQLSSTYDVVGKQIEFLKKAAVTYLNDLRNETILNLSFVGTTVVLFVAAFLWSNLIGLIAAAGLEGTNLYVQGKLWQDTITVYWKERTKTKIALNEIEGKYGSCKQNDESGFKEAQDLIAAFYTELKCASLS
jgi:Arc/MetJ-type ribon-helix-helix transcriptional regulator